MRHSSLIFTIIIGTLVVVSASARENPSAGDLSDGLEATIAPYWSVSKIEIIASVNAGDAVNPKIKQRFEATVKPDRALFAKDDDAAESLAPYIPIVPTLGTKQTRVLYGVAQSTYSAGDWRVEIDLENSVTGFGKPKSMFSGPTLVRGSKREGEVQSILASDLARKIDQAAQAKIRKTKARSQAELRSIKAAQAKALADSKTEFEAGKRELNRKKQELEVNRKSLKANAQKLEARIQIQKAANDSKMRELKAAQEKMLDERRAKYAAEKRAQMQRMDDLEAANQHEVAKARQSHQDKLDTLKATEKAEIERVKQAHAAAVSRLKAEQEGRLARLREKNQQQLAQSKAGYEHKKKVLQQQIEESSSLAALQKKKSDEEANMAAFREQALDNRAQQSQALLAKFRKKIAADNADARRSAFTAALDSGNALLRRTAMTLAFRADDPMLKTAAFEQGLNSDDKTLRHAAINAGLASDDTEQRTRALVAALDDSDRVMQHRALTEIFSDSNAITGIYEYEDDTYPFTLEISKFDNTTGALQGRLVGWRSCDDMKGGLTGNEVTMSNSRGCGAHFTLRNSSKMTGELIDRNGDRYKSRATIGD